MRKIKKGKILSKKFDPNWKTVEKERERTVISTNRNCKYFFSQNQLLRTLWASVTIQNFICSHGETSSQQSTIFHFLSLSKNALPAIAEFPSALSFRYLWEITDFSSKRNIVRCNRKSLATVQVGRRKASLIFRYPRRTDWNWLENALGNPETFFLNERMHTYAKFYCANVAFLIWVVASQEFLGKIIW